MTTEHSHGESHSCRSSKWVIRHAAAAYTLLFIGVLAAFILTVTLFDQAGDEIRERAIAGCHAANERSAISAEDFAESARQVQILDIEKLFGIDAATAAEFRRISLENATRRISRLPYFNCETGKRISAPPPSIPLN